MGALSPLFTDLPLAEHGLRWAASEISVAHPLDDGPAVILARDFDRVAERLGPRDGRSWQRLIAPFLEAEGLFADILAPLRIPKHPLAMARLGFYGWHSALRLAKRFDNAAARALLGGCAGHSILPFDKLLTGAVGLVFAISAHKTDWPVAVGGSGAITDALIGYLKTLGVRFETGRRVTARSELPEHRALLLNTDPFQLARIVDGLPVRYLRRLSRYRMGPATFKVDWALDGPIPWTDPICGEASTVHVGGSLEELHASESDAWNGRVCERPYLILCQQSVLDPTRAPAGRHTGYAYCHVPNGCDVDMTEVIEAQVERFAPGFRDRILARHGTGPAAFEAANPSLVGGAITGGAADLWQLFTRPVARLNPYTTPDPRVFLCSHSTPPGGGVHGMCGYWAARAALARALR